MVDFKQLNGLDLSDVESDDFLLPWEELEGLSEEAAEKHMHERWGYLPSLWNVVAARDLITQRFGQAALAAHVNAGELAYGGVDRLGKDAARVWYARNIKDQGFPGEEGIIDPKTGKEK